MSRAFESSAAGPLPPETVLECGVCWWTYDPRLGDEVADIPPGTAFAALPGDYRCPSCDADKAKFMVKGGAGSAAGRGVEPMAERVASLTRAYDKAEEAKLGLPVYNKALKVQATGFRAFEDLYVGVVLTPWCMNIIAVPQDPQTPPPAALGANVSHVFPSGSYYFIVGRMDGVGTVLTCSLISPLDMFDDHAVALSAAEAAVDGLFTAPPPPQTSRRGFMTGQSA